jgi:hypothetical protein
MAEAVFRRLAPHVDKVQGRCRLCPHVDEAEIGDGAVGLGPFVLSIQADTAQGLFLG